MSCWGHLAPTLHSLQDPAPGTLPCGLCWLPEPCEAEVTGRGGNSTRPGSPGLWHQELPRHPESGLLSWLQALCEHLHPRELGVPHQRCWGVQVPPTSTPCCGGLLG